MKLHLTCWPSAGPSTENRIPRHRHQWMACAAVKHEPLHLPWGAICAFAFRQTLYHNNTDFRWFRWLFSDDSSISQNLYLNSQNLFANLIRNLKKWDGALCLFQTLRWFHHFGISTKGKTWFPGAEILEFKISSRGQWLLHLNLLRTFRFLQTKGTFDAPIWLCSFCSGYSKHFKTGKDGIFMYFLCTNGNAYSFQLPYLWFPKGLRQQRVYPNVCHFLLELRCQWKMKRFSIPECSLNGCLNLLPPQKKKQNKH